MRLSTFVLLSAEVLQAVNAIELIDYGRESVDVDYAHKIQVFNRFLIDHLTTEGSSPANPVIIKRVPLYPSEDVVPPPITQLMGLGGKNVVTCMSCKHTREKEGMTHIIDLMYPRKVCCQPLITIYRTQVRKTSNEQRTVPEFAAVLRNSILRNISHKATCPACKHLTVFTSKRYIPSRDLPPMLVVNANVYNDETWELWQDNKNKTFLQPQVDLRGQIEGVDDPEVALYVLRVCALIQEDLF